MSHFKVVLPLFNLGQSLTSLIPQSVENLPAVQETRPRLLGQEDSPGEGNGKPFQNSCLGNPMDREAWQATVHGVARVGQDLATKPLSEFASGGPWT